MVKSELGTESSAIGHRLKVVDKLEEDGRELYLGPLDYLDIKEDERIWTL